MYSRQLTIDKRRSFFLFGPRGVGKTAWLRASFPRALYFDLLDFSVFNELLSSPNRLGELVPKDFDGVVILDEVQRIPELLNEVHRLIESRKLRFALTGSSARKLRRKGTNLLAGRALTRFMHPLTATELGKDFSLERALKFGTLPSACTSEDPWPYLKSYGATYLREEVLQEGLTRNLSSFTRFLETATFSQGAQLNMASVARDASIQSKTVQGYFEILEDLLLAVRLPVFSKRAKRRMTTHPKFYFFDAGVYQALRPRGPLDRSSELNGAALETLLLSELRAANDYNSLDYDLFFWRTSTQEEVDFVLYGSKGFHAFEVKLANQVRSGDLDSLKLFGEDYPEAKRYLLYLGEKEWQEHGIHVLNFEKCVRNLQSLLS